jgi:N-acetylmuramoyl-L-alanine amidase
MVRRTALALALVLALPEGAFGASRPGASGRTGVERVVAASPAPARQARSARAGGAKKPGGAPARKGSATSRQRKAPRLAEAKAAMAALMRDRTKRRYRHHWERAISNLTRAARGKDAAPALLEASRARYALYRWSANEADRDAALRLAARSARLGSRDAVRLAAAIRREAGEDDRPRGPRGAPRPLEPAREETAQDPALAAAVAGLASPAPAAGADPGALAAAGPAQVSEVRSWSSGDYTRVAIYLSRWVGWRKLELPADGGRPRRLALDFRPATIGGGLHAPETDGAQVERIRLAQNDAETVRAVLELPGLHQLQIFPLDDPPRLVVDVGTREGAAAVAAAPPGSATPGSGADAPPAATPAPGDAPPALPAPSAAPAGPSDAEVAALVERLARAEASAPAAPAPEPAAASPSPPAREAPPAPSVAAAPATPPPVPEASDRAVRRIVVDAGHGGHDPGAIGPRRVREKDVTLKLAQRLGRHLQARGYEVVLTRADDRYLALEERTALANTARGDLFVSLHANAHPHRRMAGVETYFLDVENDRYARRLAARENGADLDAEAPLAARILTDLDARASAGASRELAALVQREVTRGVRARVGDVRDLGVKSALFYVLLGARMPAVLVEAGFISNRVEERRLASAAYQEEVAAGVARAIDAYARRPTRIASAAAP